MNPTKNDMPGDKRAKSVELLNAALPTFIDLYLQAKQAHWNVKGSSFLSIHELFDDVAELAEEVADTVAERAVQLGGMVNGTVQNVNAQTSLSKYPTNITQWREHVDRFTDSLAVACKIARNGITIATQIGDIDTVDVFTEFSRKLDKQLWFLESHLQEK